jgi:myo-inositol-1(or 4)-monophosphatase
LFKCGASQEDNGMTLEDDGLDRREAFLRALMESAGALALDGFHRQAGRPAGMKGPQDYLTETDGAVEAHIRARVAAAFPEDTFLGEETGGIPGSRAWVVDPIDGTANFARSIPHFCVSIAFVAQGETRLGGIVNPALGEVFLARQGRGAFRNDAPIHVSPTKKISASSFELGWSNREPLGRYVAALTAIFEAGGNVRRSASGAMGLAYVADGRSDGYAELHMNSWDCLAGLLLVREAGGVTGPFLAAGGLERGAPVLAASPAVASVLAEATGIALLPGPDAMPPAARPILRSA